MPEPQPDPADRSRPPETFDEFVRACTHRLYRIASLLTGGDLSHAEDLVAETLARMYLAWPRVRADDAFGYSRKTMLNLHTDWRRRMRRRSETLFTQVPEVAQDTGRDRGHDSIAAQRDTIIRSLRRLTHRERAVVVLRDFLDLTEQDTARELGISLGTVKSTNARALAKLRVSPDLTEPGMTNVRSSVASHLPQPE